jgi:CTP:molybdopterin cytidylyltransferase MocA
MKVAGVVLAAGASTRLGQPKQHLRLGSETLLERTVRTASDAGLDPVFVVLSPEGQGVFDAPARIITNQEASEGMASSIRAGVAAAMEAGADGVLILACDQPAVTAGHLVELMESGRYPGGEVASAYAERKGVPAYFPASSFEALLSLRGDTGARDLLKTARTVVLKDGDLDIDTVDDWERARRVYNSVPQ